MLEKRLKVTKKELALIAKACSLINNKPDWVSELESKVAKLQLEFSNNPRILKKEEIKTLVKPKDAALMSKVDALAKNVEETEITLKEDSNFEPFLSAYQDANTTREFYALCSQNLGVSVKKFGEAIGTKNPTLYMSEKSQSFSVTIYQNMARYAKKIKKAIPKYKELNNKFYGKKPVSTSR